MEKKNEAIVIDSFAVKRIQTIVKIPDGYTADDVVHAGAAAGMAGGVCVTMKDGKVFDRDTLDNYGNWEYYYEFREDQEDDWDYNLTYKVITDDEEFLTATSKGDIMYGLEGVADNFAYGELIVPEKYDPFEQDPPIDWSTV